MTKALYSKLALEGIRKNGKLYYPYLFTCVLMAGMFYIIGFLATSDIVRQIPAGGSTQAVLKLGVFVVLIFAAIFLFYTNSFLIRRRMKEFGLYNILGMTKFHIARILFWETVVAYVCTILCGNAVGILLSKLAELGLVRLSGGVVTYEFYIDTTTMQKLMLYFAVIFAVIYLNSLRRIGFSNPIELTRSENVGEKPPKANWFIGIAGILIMGAGYGISITIQNPLSALVWFFIAVVLIIIGTYFILIAGSVLLCKCLQKNKRYYYKPNHFVSVGSMTYRMKRNGAGLASICILLTMVLVMISSTTCLYFGADSCIREQYPRNICSYATNYGSNYDGGVDYPALGRELDEAIFAAANQAGASVENLMNYCEYNLSGLLMDGYLETDYETAIGSAEILELSKIIDVHFIDLADYNRLFGANETVSDGEMLCFVNKVKGVGETLRIGDVTYSLKRVERPKNVILDGAEDSAIYGSVYLFTDDMNGVLESYKDMKDDRARCMLIWRWYCYFDTDAPILVQTDLQGTISNIISEKLQILPHFNRTCDLHDTQKSDYISTFGGLFFIGILLSVVFLVAAVLIIYYKQISEGFEDQKRFDIMKKVGMTREDIRRSINSQMLTVFLIPIVLAIVHMCATFPVVHKLLMLFGLLDWRIQILTAGISALIFALFYVVVYRITSNAYYGIVSGINDTRGRG